MSSTLKVQFSSGLMADGMQLASIHEQKTNWAQLVPNEQALVRADPCSLQLMGHSNPILPFPFIHTE